MIDKTNRILTLSLLLVQLGGAASLVLDHYMTASTAPIAVLEPAAYLNLESPSAQHRI